MSVLFDPHYRQRLRNQAGEYEAAKGRDLGLVGGAGLKCVCISFAAVPDEPHQDPAGLALLRVG